MRLAILLLGVLACEEKGTVAGSAALEAEAPPAASTTPPPPPKPPVVTVDDTSFVASGDRIDFSGGDAKGRITAMLANKPLVAGQTLEVDALRDTTMPHLAVALDSLRDAHAKGLTIKTAQRDRTMGSLDVVFHEGAVAPCAAVGMVAKDNAILVWPYGGATAQRFSHGFAGPDITLGSDALRKLANACEAQVYFVAGDDTIKWGVVFDLALAAKTGGTLKPTTVGVLTKVPVPGHKVSE